MNEWVKDTRVEDKISIIEEIFGIKGLMRR